MDLSLDLDLGQVHPQAWPERSAYGPSSASALLSGLPGASTGCTTARSLYDAAPAGTGDLLHPASHFSRRFNSDGEAEYVQQRSNCRYCRSAAPRFAL